MLQKNLPTICLAAVVAALLGMAAGCSDSVSTKRDHDHVQGPPHGGTPVLIAEHKFHLELVRDPASGVMQAYVLDDHMEEYVAVPETNFTLTASISGRTEKLDLLRLPNPADGKLTSASFLFEGRAEWVKAATNFDGLISTITLKGQTYTNISFPFPKGTHHIH
jgi:hypothetical protein